jgi:O-methyltransferase
MATVAKLGVADIVGSEPVPVEELAARVGADPSALHRVLRLLASDGIFSEATPGAFIGTPLSEGLREDQAHSIRYLALQQGGPTYLAAGQMLQCVRTGEPAAETVFGRPFFEYLAADSEASEIFNRAMAGTTRARVAAALEYDWSSASVVTDIGGGNGSLLTAVLGAQPQLRGVVFDLPHVVAEARPIIEEAGLSERCELVGGDFFADSLPSADTYLFAQILHDWDDERAVGILRNCRRSITEDGRLLVLEQVVPEGDEPSYAKVIDLIMMTVLGGKERTQAEWDSLLRAGGFELVGITLKPAAALIAAAPA